MEPATTISEPPRHLGTSQMPHSLDRDDATVIDIASARVEVKVWGSQSNGGFSLIEYEIPPRTVVAPLHRHTWEDEVSFVLEGRIGAILGDVVIYARAGELVFKPRRLWHTFWNPTGNPCRALEIISPGGFEHFFDELGAAVRCSYGSRELEELGDRYGVQFDLPSVQRLCAQHGLKSPLLHAS